MRNVLVVGLSDNIGGIETFFHSYYEKFNTADYHFDFVTVCNTIAFEPEYVKNGSIVYLLPHFMKKPLLYYRKLRRIIRENEYDVIHINMLSAANILPIVASIKEGVHTVLIHSHNSDTPNGVLRKCLHLVNKRYVRSVNADRLACSRRSGEWLFGKNSNYTIISNAININKYRFNAMLRKTVRDKNGITENDFLIGNVGRLVTQKNQSFLIEVLNDISDINIKLMLVGSGDKKKELLEKVERNNLSDRVIFIENTNEIAGYYSAFDLFVFPSLFEGMPIAPIEAQASGLACLTTPNVAIESVPGKLLPLSLRKDLWVNEILRRKEKGGLKDRKVNVSNEYNIDSQFEKLLKFYSGESHE